jgi:hypothetical protein
MGYQNPQKRWANDNVVWVATIRWMFRNRRWAQLKCNNSIRNWGLKQQLHLKNKKTHKTNVNEALRDHRDNKVIKLAARSSVRIQKSKNECQDTVEELAIIHVKEETAHSLRYRDVWALFTLKTFALTDRKKIWWCALGYLGGAVLLGAMWHICWRQQLWRQQRQTLQGNSSANMLIARQQLCNMQQWSNLEVVFSTQSMPTATWWNNRRTAERHVFYVVCSNTT